MLIQIIIIAAVAIGSYLIGNINVALAISKLKRGDIRKMGSGNPGTMNMIRNFGAGFGAITMGLDILKGALPCILGWLFVGGIGFGDDRLGLYVGGFCVIVGHIFPVFLGFKGGKGIASSIGICLVCQPIIGLITLVGGILFIFVSKMGSITSFIIISIPLGIEAYSVTAAGGDSMIACAFLIFGLFALTLFAHRKNVIKLFAGTESQTIILGKNRSAKKAKEAREKAEALQRELEEKEKFAAAESVAEISES